MYQINKIVQKYEALPGHLKTEAERSMDQVWNRYQSYLNSLMATLRSGNPARYDDLLRYVSRVSDSLFESKVSGTVRQWIIQSNANIGERRLNQVLGGLKDWGLLDDLGKLLILQSRIRNESELAKFFSRFVFDDPQALNLEPFLLEALLDNEETVVALIRAHPRYEKSRIRGALDESVT